MRPILHIAIHWYIEVFMLCWGQGTDCVKHSAILLHCVYPQKTLTTVYKDVPCNVICDDRALGATCDSYWEGGKVKHGGCNSI